MAYGQSPSVDGFDPDAAGPVASVAIQADGRLVVGGSFGALAGQTRQGLGRLNADGSLDSTFGGSASAMVYSLAVQPDGKILAAGDFTALSGRACSFLGRLNTNGTLDTGFRTTLFAPPPFFTLVSARVQAVLVLPDGRLMVGGRQQYRRNGSQTSAATGYISRLNPDGSTDTAFAVPAGVNGPVGTLALQPDGRILAGGLFTSMGGQARSRIGRLEPDGTLDNDFSVEVGSTGYGAVLALAVQPDGRILVGGQFTNVAGQPRTNLARLNPDGTLDNNFAPAATGSGYPAVYSFAVQTDGKIILSGLFTNVAGHARSNLARLYADGTLDEAFDPGADRTVYGMALQADGRLLAVGEFTQLAGQPRHGIGRLEPSEPATQSLADGGSTLTWLRGGSSPEVWRTTFESSSDFTNWNMLGGGQRVAGGWELAGQSGSRGDWIRLRGATAGGAGNGSSWFTETIDGPCRFLSQPRTQTRLAGAAVSFSAHAVGSPPLSYRWWKDGEPVQDSAGVVGAQTSVLTLRGAFGSDAGGYSLVVSNAFGSSTSTVATLTVLDPRIVNYPVDYADVVGSTATFSVTVVGSPPLGFRWQKDGVDLEDGGKVSGAATETLTLTDIAGSDRGNYSLVVTNVFGGSSSGPARLSVVDPIIVAEPVSLSVPQGQSASLQVKALGSAPLQYLWRKDGTDLVGQTGSTLTVVNAGCADGGLYTVHVSNPFGSVTSAEAFLTVDANETTVHPWNPGATGAVESMALLTDGRLLVGGILSQLGGQPCENFGLLHPDGTFAAGFAPPVSGTVHATLIQADGKMVLGGSFSVTGGQPRKCLARLNADGSLDVEFNPGVGGAIEWPEVRCLAAQTDGKILVGGLFTMLGGQARSFLGRLNPDGTPDAFSNPTVPTTIRTILVQPDGKIVIGGEDTLWRLLPDGTRDHGFVGEATGGSVVTLALQQDGRILVGGGFKTLSRGARQGLGRLNPDGTLDAGFTPNVYREVSLVALHCDGRILVHGPFTNLCGQMRQQFGRLNPDGSLDCTFDRGLGPLASHAGGLVICPDGDVLVGGHFDLLGGQPRSSLGRLTTTGAAKDTLAFDGWRITWVRDGTSPEVGWTSFEASTNGVDWRSLGVGARVPGGWKLDGVILPARSSIRARGVVQDRSSWFVEKVLVVDPALPPRILTDDGQFGFQHGELGFTVVGIVGQMVVVEASEAMSSWTALGTNTLSAAGAFFVDARPPSSSARFYRVRTP